MQAGKLAATAVLVLAAAAGCKSTSSGPGLHASGLASVPGADKTAMIAIVKQCAPVTAGGVQQLRWATAMVNDTKTHPNGSRQRLLGCVGIPAAKRPAAEGALLTAVEHVHWTRKADRARFWDATLPAWVMTWRSA